MWPEIVKSKTQSWRLEPTGPVDPGETSGLMGMGSGLASQEALGQVFARVID